MTEKQQKDELFKKIWAMANKVRNNIDAWDFKQYILGSIFYRYISENFQEHIEGGDSSIDYSQLSDDDEVITKDVVVEIVAELGYFIYPSQLFCNVIKNASNNKNLNIVLKEVFESIEGSAIGTASEQSIKGLFADFDTRSSRLGGTVDDKSQRLADVLLGVADINFESIKDSKIDVFGDAYEYIISQYAANAGKSGGEYFTPQMVSKLLARLAISGQESINKVYDPAAGSGSLLLQVRKVAQEKKIDIEEGFFGQEINHTTYNLARMNMFLHDINYSKFDIKLGNTLINPLHLDARPFDVIVSNPPYSINWIGKDDPTLINDLRYAPAGVLAPQSKADFAFIMHTLSHLSSKGKAAIVCFPGIFYRSGAEQTIRQYLIDNNFVESVISLAPNLFYGTTIAVNLLVLSKNKQENSTQFIDLTSDKYFKKETNNNILTDEIIEDIVKIFDEKKDVEFVSRNVSKDEIVKNDYSLAINTYVEKKDLTEKINIKDVNKELESTVENISRLRKQIDQIVKDLEGTNE